MKKNLNKYNATTLSGFEQGRRESVNLLRDMMRYKYVPTTGRMENENGDIAPSMAEAVKLNNQLDKDIPEEPLLDRTSARANAWKKVLANRKKGKGDYENLSTSDIVIAEDQAEKLKVSYKSEPVKIDWDWRIAPWYDLEDESVPAPKPKPPQKTKKSYGLDYLLAVDRKY